MESLKIKLQIVCLIDNIRGKSPPYVYVGRVGSKNKATFKLVHLNTQGVGFNMNGWMHSQYTLISFQFILQSAGVQLMLSWPSFTVLFMCCGIGAALRWLIPSVEVQVLGLSATWLTVPVWYCKNRIFAPLKVAILFIYYLDSINRK